MRGLLQQLRTHFFSRRCAEYTVENADELVRLVPQLNRGDVVTLPPMPNTDRVWVMVQLATIGVRTRYEDSSVSQAPTPTGGAER
jgi:hypothetical protein